MKYDLKTYECVHCDVKYMIDYSKERPACPHCGRKMKTSEEIKKAKEKKQNFQ